MYTFLLAMNVLEIICTRVEPPYEVGAPFFYYIRGTFKMRFKYYMPKIRVNLTKISISPTIFF